jgi:hypothetical protein
LFALTGDHHGSAPDLVRGAGKPSNTKSPAEEEATPLRLTQ